MPTLYSVQGPFTVPFRTVGSTKLIDSGAIREFWDENEDYAFSKGCYIFGVRAGRGITPGYVGRATKGFKAEVFTSHKLIKYQHFLAEYRKGTPLFYFVEAPANRGKFNLTHVKQLENFLIQSAVAVNPDLQNIQGTKDHDWGIAGVIRSGPGGSSHAAQDFRRMLKF